MPTSTGLRSQEDIQSGFGMPAAVPKRRQAPPNRPKTGRRYLLNKNKPSKYHTLAKSIYSSSPAPCSSSKAKKAASPPPAWNPYQSSNDKYALTKAQMEKRKEMFKSKNNILLSPDAAKEKKKKALRRRKGENKGSSDQNVVENENENENAAPNQASPDSEELPPPPSHNAAITPAKVQGAETLMSLRNTSSPDLTTKVSALSISQTLKNYQKSLEQLEKRVENPTPLGDTNAAYSGSGSSSLKDDPAVENLMANISKPPTPPTVPSVVEADNELAIKLAKLEALVESQRTYIEKNIAVAESGAVEGRSEVVTNAVLEGIEENPIPPPSAVPYKPLSSGGNMMNILGFENAASYLDLNNPEPLAPLETSTQVYEDIRRAREHAEYLAGEYSRKEGYLGGVLEEVEEEVVARAPQSVVDISSLPLPNSPVPTPPPVHPFKAKGGMGMGMKLEVMNSPNFNDASPEVTRPVKVVRRGGVSDWSAPVV
ncbi:hypothetical protein TrST_g11924 [Triparma strigata]|uniref:Uncharacterized protein n=1 Tax=Triparma strigata TaxID=1606541 RepID=A0A9W7EW60_9STRA|nr:hypothetical protein TrST_g11924 [Triparma strigata]